MKICDKIKGLVKYIFIFKNIISTILEWNAHENAVFDIAWMEGQEMLVRTDNAVTTVIN